MNHFVNYTLKVHGYLNKKAEKQQCDPNQLFLSIFVKLPSAVLLSKKEIREISISCSSHVNNQSWILNVPILFTFLRDVNGLFGSWKLPPCRKDINKKIKKKIRMFRIQDWLLTCNEQDALQNYLKVKWNIAKLTLPSGPV